MQKAEPAESANTVESVTNTPWEVSDRKARSAEYFEAWKKAAERKARMIFASVPLGGPTIPDELSKEASDAVRRVTWRHACRYMADEEKLAACRVKRKEMEEYAWALAQKAAAEQWKRALAASTKRTVIASSSDSSRGQYCGGSGDSSGARLFTLVKAPSGTRVPSRSLHSVLPA